MDDMGDLTEKMRSARIIRYVPIVLILGTLALLMAGAWLDFEAWLLLHRGPFGDLP